MQQNNQQSTIVFDPQKTSQLKIAVVVARFNETVTGKLKGGALEHLKQSGVPIEQVETFWVPGSIELPLACKRIASTGLFHGIVAIGCVIKGETDHYFYISNEASRGIMEVMLHLEIPIGFGMLTVPTLDLALARAEGPNNKGKEAAQAMLEMILSFPSTVQPR